MLQPNENVIVTEEDYFWVIRNNSYNEFWHIIFHIIYFLLFEKNRFELTNQQGIRTW